MKEHFSDEEILGYLHHSLYFMHAVMTRAPRLEFDDRNEVIVEVAAPEDFDASNLPAGAVETIEMNEKFEIRGVNHIAMVCADMSRTVRFYRDVLQTTGEDPPFLEAAKL